MALITIGSLKSSVRSESNANCSNKAFTCLRCDKISSLLFLVSGVLSAVHDDILTTSLEAGHLTKNQNIDRYNVLVGKSGLGGLPFILKQCKDLMPNILIKTEVLVKINFLSSSF